MHAGQDGVGARCYQLVTLPAGHGEPPARYCVVHTPATGFRARRCWAYCWMRAGSGPEVGGALWGW